MPLRLFSALLLSCALLAATPQARADKDAVQFGSNIVVPEGKSIHDAVCFFCSVDARGDIDHDVVVFFGNVHIAHQSKHDIVNFFGSVRADDNAVIGHDLVNFFGSVHLGEDASVGNDVVVMFGALHTADTANIQGNRLSQPPWLFWTPFLVISLVVIIVVREIRGHRRRQYLAAYGYPPVPPPPPAPPMPKSTS